MARTTWNRLRIGIACSAAVMGLGLGLAQQGVAQGLLPPLGLERTDFCNTQVLVNAPGLFLDCPSQLGQGQAVVTDIPVPPGFPVVNNISLSVLRSTCPDPQQELLCRLDVTSDGGELMMRITADLGRPSAAVFPASPVWAQIACVCR